VAPSLQALTEAEEDSKRLMEERNSLSTYASGSHDRVIQNAINNGVIAPNYKDDKGWTLLHRVARNRDANTAKLLIKHGASPFIKDSDNKIPLNLARENLDNCRPFIILTATV
jgi:ankyrin repeat protein